MQVKVKINGVDFARCATRDGVEIYPIYRQQQSVVVLNGTKFSTKKKKDGIKIQLIEMRDSVLSSLISSVSDLCTVEYTDMDTGSTKTAKFYARVGGIKAKRVSGGNTYCGGVVIELEEK